MRAWPAPAQGLLATGFSGSITPPLNLSPLANFDTAIQLNGQQQFSYDGANSTGLRNGTNAQVLSVYNTFTAGTPDYERFEINWAASAGVCILRVSKNGTGSNRSISIAYASGTSTAITVPAASTSAISFCGSNASTAMSSGRVQMLNVGMSATSGAHVDWSLGDGTGPNPSSTSTMFYSCFRVNPTINYSNGTPGAGKVYCLYLAPVNTALPTGQNAAIALSTTASALGGLVFDNQADEDTNFEKFRISAVSNVWTIASVKGGTGTARSIAFATAGTSRVQLDILGNVVLNNSGSALGTGATDGFTHVPNCAGTPTGAATSFTGATPMVYDSTANKIWFRSGGTWRGVAVV